MAVTTFDFTGTTGAAWPAGWATAVTSPGVVNINANRGLLTSRNVAYTTGNKAYLTTVNSTDLDVTFDVSFAAIAEQYFNVELRCANSASADTRPTNAYFLQIFPGNGANSMGVSKRVAGTETGISGDIAAGAFTVNTAKRIRFSAVGNTLSVRVWDPAGSEPGTWAWTGTDSSHAAASGSLLFCQASGGAATSRTAYVDNVSLTYTANTPSPTGIASTEAFGSPTITTTGPVTALPTGIASAQAFGSPTITAAIPTVPNQTSGVLLRTTAGGTPIYKYRVVTDAVTGGLTTAEKDAYLYVPASKSSSPSAKFVMAGHGYMDTVSTFMEQPSATLPLLDLLADAGYVVIVPDYEATLGNANGQARLLRAYNYLTGKWAAAGTVLFGFSMGTATSTVAMHKGTIPDIKAAQLVSPIIDWITMADPGEGLSAQWYAAWNTNSAGFAAATAAWDPIRQPASAWAGDHIRANSSTDDGYPIRPSTVTWLDNIRSSTAEAIDVQVFGTHGSSGQFVNPDQMVAFFEANTSTFSPTGIASAQAFGTPTATFTVTASPAGVSTAEALGTPTATATLTASPGGIATSEAFGTLTANVKRTASPSGIAAGEAFGTPVANVVSTASPTGIATAQAFGTPVLTPTLTASPSGIAGAEAVGTPSISAVASVSPSGIVSTEAFGTLTANVKTTASPAGVAGAEAFGTPSVSAALTASPAGISTAEATGTPAVTATLAASPSGITSAQAFGTPVLSTTVTASPAAIGAAEAFGTVTANVISTVSPAGIATAQAFGTPAITATLTTSPSGIATAQAFGTPALSTTLTTSPAGIASAEAFGVPGAAMSGIALPTGIPSAEAFGTLTLTRGTLNVSSTGIATAEAFGTPVANVKSTASPTGIAAAEAFGTPSAVAGAVTVSPAGVSGAEAFGTPAVTATGGPISASPSGIASAQAFGSPSIGLTLTAIPNAMGTAEAFGVPVLTRTLTVSPTSLGSGGAFGSPAAVLTLTAAPAGIGSLEALGTLAVLLVKVLFPAGIASAEVFGVHSVSVGQPPEWSGALVVKRRESGVWASHPATPKVRQSGGWVPARGMRWNGSAWIDL